MSIRFRLALSYAVFLVVAGMIVLFGVYVVLRYVPDATLSAGPQFNRDGLLPVNVEAALAGVSGFVLVALAIIGLAGGWLIAGLMLRPIDRINRAARVAATGRLDHRIRLSGPHDEFRELADSFDHMLERLNDAFETQERFAANASHELRTPLTITATLLDVAQADPAGQDYPRLIERLRLTNARAIGITEALLRLSNANAIALNAEPLDLAEIVYSSAVEHADEVIESRVAIDMSLVPAPMAGDRTLLEQLASNLVQNAIRHNDQRGEVFVRTEYQLDPLRAVLCVENTGASYTEAEVSRLTEPFLRGHARIRGANPVSGHGLGLALVDRITALHGGRLSIAPREGGGLVATVSFPARTSRGPSRYSREQKPTEGPTLPAEVVPVTQSS